MSKKENQLTKGWEVKKLSDVAEYFNGLTYSPKNVSDKGTIVLRSSNIQNDSLDFTDLVRVNMSIKEKLFVKEGDILMCSRNGSQRLVGKSAPILNLNESMTFGTFMMIIRSDYGPYLLWFFKTDEFKKQISGGENTMINQVTRYMLDEIEILLPPLPEQQRIVSILDEAFAAIAKAKANAEQNLKNAKELFESYLQGVFEEKGEGWEEKKLGEVVIYDKKQSLHKGLPYVGLEHIESNSGRFLGCLDAQVVKSSTFYFDEQHVLYGRLRPYLNKVLLPNFRGHCSTEIFPIKVCKLLTREFLFYWLISMTTVNKIDATWTGARMPRANMNQVLEFDFSFPSVKEQQIIVSQLDALRAETQKLEAIYKKKLADLEELKKSVLQKAFGGEL